MNRIDFSNYSFKALTTEAKNEPTFETAEKITLKPSYTKEDTADFIHTKYRSGFAPF